MADDQVFSIHVFQNKWNVLISGSKSLEPAIELLRTTVFDSSYTFLKLGLTVLLSTLLVTSYGFLHIKEHLGFFGKTDVATDSSEHLLCEQFKRL